MNRVLHRAGIFLIASALVLPMAGSWANADDSTKPFIGKFSDNVLTVELAASGGGLAGTFTLSNQQFPAKASVSAQGTLSGSFTATGTEYPFTATLANNQMTLVSGGKTYTLIRSGGNPLADNAPANPLAQQAQSAAPAADPDAATATLLGPFSLLGSTSNGKTLFVKLPGGLTLEAGITQAADDLAKVLDAKPAIGGAFARAQSKNSGGATFTVKMKGKEIRGTIFCGVAPGGGSATVVMASADAPREELSTLLSFLPAELKTQTHQFPDNSGSIDLPQGWTTADKTAAYGVRIAGPAGQFVVIGGTLSINTPNCMLVKNSQKLYQMQLQNYTTQERNYQQSLAMKARFPNIPMQAEPKKPTPPDPDPNKQWPQLLFCQLCDGPADVQKYLSPVMEEKGKNLPEPAYTTLDKVIESVSTPANPQMPRDKAGVVYLAVTDHKGDKTTAYRAINRIETCPIGDGTESWLLFVSSMRAPDVSFDKDLPVMNAIMASFKPNMDVVNKRMADDGAQQRAYFAKQNDLMLQRGRDFQKQQADNFNRFESQMAAQQQARHDSSSDFIEYIRGVRDVYDTRTGQTASVDLFNVHGIVNGMNDATNDPNRFVEIPLRYER